MTTIKHVAFDRLYDGFAYLDLDGAQIMLEERDRSRNWIVGPMEALFGRSINFQIGARTIDPILASLAAADWPLFMKPEEKWYRNGDVEAGVHHFLVQDPDGYLIRFLVGPINGHIPIPSRLKHEPRVGARICA